MYYAICHIATGEIVKVTKSEGIAAEHLDPGHCYGWHPEKTVAMRNAYNWAKHWRTGNIPKIKKDKRNKPDAPHRCPGCGGFISMEECPLCIMRAEQTS